MMNIVAVVVTYNRLALLKKCVQAVIEQTRKPDSIIVINNGSTDGTEEWLAGQPVITYTQANNGGAGGFSEGIKRAYNHQADWIWVMDDDTIPQHNTLEKLLAPLEELKENQEDIGFLCSNILWTDGNAHAMNLTYQLHDKHKLAKLPLAGKKELPFIQFGTFVSMLISSKAVEKIGLPIKEYFIWNDDVEYTKRIVNSGMAGLAVKDSIAIHETPINNMSSVFKDSHVHLWKYSYGMRNELYTKLLHQGKLHFWATWIHRMFVMPFRILLNRKSHRWPFIKMIWQTSLKALFFHPELERA